MTLKGQRGKRERKRRGEYLLFTTFYSSTLKKGEKKEL